MSEVRHVPLPHRDRIGEPREEAETVESEDEGEGSDPL